MHKTSLVRIVSLIAIALCTFTVIGAGCNTSLSTSEPTDAQAGKTVKDYLQKPTYQQKKISSSEFFSKDTEEIFTAYTGDSSNGGYELFYVSFYSDKNWKDGKNHEFYIEASGDDGSQYYGPYVENIADLLTQAREIKKDEKISDTVEMLDKIEILETNK